MRKTVLISLLSAAAAAACKKEEAPPAPAAPSAAAPSAPAPSAPAPEPAKPSEPAPAAPAPPADAAGATPTNTAPGAAAAGGDEVRPPTKEDLATYTKGLKGKGPLKAKIETSMGTLNCELADAKVPMTVANFVGLARGLKPFRDPKSGKVEKRPFYDGLTFHRVIPDFMIQGGDPLGLGMGDPGYQFATEVDPSLTHKAGTLAMANKGPDTNGAQFYVTERATPHLDGGYNVFGYCKEVEVVKKIARVERGPNDRPAQPVTIKKVTISR